ncbi:MAG TPA: excinuclease ABC subunit UvrC [Fimbriimonadaceae bacterium]|nr:excinuclease ABC subunit UvrC [Fimbriimonadaceae bacterium]
MPPASLPDRVTERLKSVPKKPGCYIYRDQKGGVLYVGKAVDLRSRVRSYFRKSANHGVRIERMVHRVADIEWIVVDSELEALVLECNLIKEHRPPYNVRLRDDKSYPFIVVTKEAFPRVLFTRNPRKGSGRVFGPYTSAYAVRETLQLLHKVFPLIPCGKSWSGREEQRPCLYFHLGQCLAPCAGLADKAEYKQVVQQVVDFLNGKEAGVIDALKCEMEAASQTQEYEKAAALRDRITALESVLEKQKVLSDDEQDRDIVAVVKDDRGAAIQMLYVRGGRLIGQRNFILDGSKDSAPTDAVQEFVKQYYSDVPEVPREILLPVEIAEKQIVQQWLRQRRGAAVTIDVPQGGEGLRLVDLAAQNAEQALKTLSMEMEQKEQWAEQASAQLAEELGLPSPPQRVECYDISNIQGKAPVGSMVVMEDGETANSEYRRFKIRYHPEDPNDFAMMHEVITRRLRAYLDGDEKFSKLPDLIVVDGGKGQLSAALKARDALNLSVTMVGLAKRHEIVYVPALKPPSPLHRRRGGQGGEDTETSPLVPKGRTLERGRGGKDRYIYREVVLPLTSPGLMLLRRLRDEAHRFAITYHRKLRDKRLHGSVLDEIPGIGPKRRRLLLRTFGSIEGIRRASVEEIAAVPTLTKRQAETVSEFLRVE